MKYLLAFIILLGLVACTKQDATITASKDQYAKMAEAIALKIPKDSRVALKIDPPEKSGLPEVFLKKLMAEFSGSLLRASNSKFQILNRNSTEEIWKDAVEFSNKDISKITQSAQADVIVSLSPKINEKGIDLSVSAFSTRDSSMGDILAATSELIPMNVKSEIGVNVNGIDKKLDKLTELLDKNSSVKDNELAKIFVQFSKASDLNFLARTYSTGCEKPIALASLKIKEDGFRIKCELYNNGELIIWENIDFNKSVNIDLILGAARGLVDSIKLGTSGPNDLHIPQTLDNYSKLIACGKFDTASGFSRFYKITIPGGEVFYALYEGGGGSGGTFNYLTLHKDFDIVPKRGNKDYRMVGEKLDSDPSTRCGE